MYCKSIIKTVIVEDEEHSRNELKYLLDQHSDINVVGQAANCQQALTLIDDVLPDLVFMDIQMPGMCGIEAVEVMTKSLHQPIFVFATAHEEFAIKAFELNAADYILKPFSAARINQCLMKIRSLISKTLTVPKPVDMPRERLAIEHNGKNCIVNTNDIIMACCSDGYVLIYTNNKCYQSNMTLHELQDKLAGSSFFRSHRSYLINLEKVVEIIPWFNGTYNVILDGLANQEIPVSRQQATILKKLFAL